jgi:hypothetical protein
MTSCPLSLKTIPAHNSSQRDIKHPLERMSAKISRKKEKGEEEKKSIKNTSFYEERN